MDHVFNYEVEVPEFMLVQKPAPWTKTQIVLATTFAFTTACIASVFMDKTLEKAFQKF